MWWLWCLQVPLTLSDVYQRVIAEHPLARSIGLYPRVVEAEAVAARGVWDPTFTGSLTEKNFKNQLYFTLFSANLKVPLWNGLDFKGLYENTGGFSLNPEDITPSAGLLGAGFSIPLGQGLLIDYRRAAIQKAQLYARMAPHERQLLLADLILEVAKDYWGWFSSYYKVRVYRQQLAVAAARLRFLRDALVQGEATRADTLEAFVEFNLRQQQLIQSQGELFKKSLLVQRHLWNDTVREPAHFHQLYRPDSLLPAIPREKWEILVSQHPKLRLYEFKRRVAEVNRRWAAERLRPQLQAEYLFLRDPESWQKGWEQPFRTNFKFGLTLGMSLYMREARGDLAAARLELRRLQLEQEFEARSLYNKALGQLGLIDSLARQIEVQRELIQGLFELVELENIRLRAGESDLFVVNRREREAFSALISLYDLYARYGEAIAELQGILAWVEDGSVSK
ncbi:MAG: TolC family protein [Bacteroidia bacterium]|nr:TolC family protein [Bacteroidia bacterium]MCX7652892.1 TolC family protein [Bacteroidia bacterium]MDW8416640.1 TolC family protein [Bacteroidia bacterium]